jgi:large subunit ribosomal protein L2
MIFKKYKPTTPSLRHLKLLKKEKELCFNTPLKSETFFKKEFAGRNNQGKITIYQRGGGKKKLFRKINFLRNDLKGIVEKIEYDPNRTAYIARIFDFLKKNHFYILASSNLKRGDYIQSGENSPLKEGNSLPLSQIPIGFIIHNLSIKANFKGQFIRSAGTYGQLIQKNVSYARIKLPSGEQKLVSIKNYATIGMVSNLNHCYTVLGKAGRSRWKNKRPIVRGVAMNPVDHPHGGGEGKTSGGRPSVTPWGKPTKGQPTKKLKKKSIVDYNKS